MENFDFATFLFGVINGISYGCLLMLAIVYILGRDKRREKKSNYDDNRTMR